MRQQTFKIINRGIQMKKKMTYISLMLVLLLGNAANCQENSFLTARNQITFSLKPVLSGNLKLNHTGQKLLNSSPAIGGEGSIGYRHAFNNELAVNVGIGLGVLPYYLHTDFHFAQGNGPHEVFFYEATHYYFMPVSLQKRLWPHHRKNPFVEAGGRLNFYSPFEISHGFPHDQFYFIVENFQPEKFMGYFVKAGLISYTKADDCHCRVRRINTWTFSMAAHYSPRPVGTGKFRIQTPGYHSSGDVRWTINYLGFDFKYGFNLKKSG